MKHHDHYHCPICAAEFPSQRDMQSHQRARHSEHNMNAAAGTASPNGPSRDSDALHSTRKNTEFTRRNPE